MQLFKHGVHQFMS